MSYYLTGDYDDGYNWTHQVTSYDVVPYWDSVSFSDFESHDPVCTDDHYYQTSYDACSFSGFHESKFIEYHHHPLDYGDAYDYSYCSTQPEIIYSVYNHAEPKLVVYEPVPCDMGYVSYHTQYSTSYLTTNLDNDSDSGFNEPDFEEYDPTPYGGGYDIVSTYGKPLPPSDKICYPPSTGKSIEPNPMPKDKPLEPEPIRKLEPDSAESKPIPLTAVVPVPVPIPEPEFKHKPESKPIPTAALVPVPDPEPEFKHKPESNPMPEPEPEPEPEPMPLPMPESVPEPELQADTGLLDWSHGEKEKKEDYSYPSYGYDYPWPEYDHGYDIGRGGGGFDYGHGKQLVQVPPCEYDPDVVDFCESIFGDWPCLARIRRQQERGINHNHNHNHNHNQGCKHHNPWEGCGNYIFGGPVVHYNEKDYGRDYKGGSSHGIYYQQQPTSVEEGQYDEGSWIHKLNIFP